MKLPKDWDFVALRELADVNPNSLEGGTSPTYRFRYIDLSSVERGRVTVPEEAISFVDAPSRARRIIQSGDIIMSMVRPNLQGHAYFAQAAPDLIASTEFAVIRTTGADSRFVYQSIFGGKTTSQLERLLVGSNYPAINSSDVEELLLALPSKAVEQKRIAEILFTWDEALEKLDALIAAKDRRKQALMQQLLTGKKRFPAFGKKEWKRVGISKLLERVFRPIEWSAEISLSLISIRRRCGGLFRRPELLGSEYKTQDLHDLKAGDFLVSKRQVAHGAWAMITPEFEGGHVSKEYAIFTNTAPDKLHMPFFAWLAQTPRMIRLSRVASTGVHIEKLIFDPAVFLRESIRLPATLEEQQHIAAILDAADQEITLLRKQRNALDQQKRGLMQRLLTGKIRVKV